MIYKHIVFDIDGTILDTEQAILKSLQETVSQIKGCKPDLAELYFALGIPGEYVLKQLEIEDKQAGNAVWNDNLNKYSSSIALFDGVGRMLKELKKRNLKVGVITSRNRMEYQKDFLSFDISKEVDYAINADDTILHKPTAEPMNAYLEQTGAKRQEVIYIGDSIYDMQCALSAGVDCALALWGCHSSEGIQATYYLHQPYDVIKLLEISPALDVERAEYKLKKAENMLL